MTPERIKELEQKRKILANDPESAALVQQIDRLLGKKREPRRTTHWDREVGKNTIIARIPTGASAEVRIGVNTYSTMDKVDVRVWFVPHSSDQYVPSRKGVSIGIGQLAAVIAALQEARSFVDAGPLDTPTMTHERQVCTPRKSRN